MKLIKYFFLWSLILSNLSANTLHDLIKKGNEKQIISDFETNYYRAILLSKKQNKKQDRKNYVELVDMCDKKLDFLNEQDENGNTPLHLACKRKFYTLSNLLIGIEGVRQDIKNKDGQLAKDLLVGYDKKSAIDSLFEAGYIELKEESNYSGDETDVENIDDSSELLDNEVLESTQSISIIKRKMSEGSLLGSSPNNPKNNLELKNKIRIKKDCL